METREGVRVPGQSEGIFGAFGEGVCNGGGLSFLGMNLAMWVFPLCL